MEERRIDPHRESHLKELLDFCFKGYRIIGHDSGETPEDLVEKRRQELQRMSAVNVSSQETVIDILVEANKKHNIGVDRIAEIALVWGELYGAQPQSNASKALDRMISHLGLNRHF